MKSLSGIYEEKLAVGALQPDVDQRRAVAALTEYKPPSPLGTFLRRLTGAAKNGYYLHGGVGRGKSMVMDMFFASAPVEKKRRVHFHAFMLEVHDFLHARRTSREKGMEIDSDLLACADKIAAEARLLCFDEFQVKDVADARIYGGLFRGLSGAGSRSS
jgi:cell division protein ZapE